MTSKKHIVIAVLASFCLTSTLFMILPTRSQSDDLEYNPWADLNEDGIIDIYDVVGVTGIYETTGTPVKNVNVTNWPLGFGSTSKEFAFFNYEYGSKPTVYSSDIDSSTYWTTETTFLTVENYTVDGTKWRSNLSTRTLVEIECQVYVSVYPIDVNVVINGQSHLYLGLGAYNSWQSYELWPASEINTSRTDNEILVQCRSSANGIAVDIRNLRLRFHYEYSKRELASPDFGFSKLYLRSVTLDPEEAIKLNQDPTQTIMNNKGSVVIYEFSERVPFSTLEFVSGTPEILVYAEAGT